jgi:hypothetical protein
MSQSPLFLLSTRPRSGYAEWVDGLLPALTAAANAHLRGGPARRAGSLHEVVDGAVAIQVFQAATRARRDAARTEAALPSPAAPPARRCADEGPTPSATTVPTEVDLLTQFPHAVLAALRLFTGADGGIYARFITALPAEDRAAANSYLLSAETPTEDVVTAVTNASLAAAPARAQPTATPAVAATTPAAATNAPPAPPGATPRQQQPEGEPPAHVPGAAAELQALTGAPRKASTSPRRARTRCPHRAG